MVISLAFTCNSSYGDEYLKKHDSNLWHHIQRKTHHIEKTNGHESLGGEDNREMTVNGVKKTNEHKSLGREDNR